MKSQGSRQDESLKREGKERRKSVRVCLAALLTRSVTRRWSCDSNLASSPIIGGPDMHCHALGKLKVYLVPIIYRQRPNLEITFLFGPHQLPTSLAPSPLALRLIAQPRWGLTVVVVVAGRWAVAGWPAWHQENSKLLIFYLICLNPLNLKLSKIREEKRRGLDLFFLMFFNFFLILLKSTCCQLLLIFKKKLSAFKDN